MARRLRLFRRGSRRARDAWRREILLGKARRGVPLHYDPSLRDRAAMGLTIVVILALLAAYLAPHLPWPHLPWRAGGGAVAACAAAGVVYLVWGRSRGRSRRPGRARSPDDEGEPS